MADQAMADALHFSAKPHNSVQPIILSQSESLSPTGLSDRIMLGQNHPPWRVFGQEQFVSRHV